MMLPLAHALCATLRMRRIDMNAPVVLIGHSAIQMKMLFWIRLSAVICMPKGKVIKHGKLRKTCLKHMALDWQCSSQKLTRYKVSLGFFTGTPGANIGVMCCSQKHAKQDLLTTGAGGKKTQTQGNFPNLVVVQP